MQFRSREGRMQLSDKLLNMDEVIEMERQAKQQQSLFEAIFSRSQPERDSQQDKADIDTDTSSFKYDQDIVIKSLADEEERRSNPSPPKTSPSCKCKKSKCLRMYCECFSLYGHCGPHCSCENCHNVPSQDPLRRSTLVYLRNKYPDIKRKLENMEKQKVEPISCNCKKSFCQKKYCECFVLGMECSTSCKCIGCRNCHIQRQDVYKKPKRETSPNRLRFMTYNSSPQKFIQF